MSGLLTAVTSWVDRSQLSAQLRLRRPGRVLVAGVLVIPTDWIAVQAVATIVLVLITAWYAKRIKEQADAAAEAAEATRRSAKATERLAELTAPEVRASRADALAQIRQLAETLYGQAENAHRVEDLDGLAAHLDDLDSSGGLVTSSQRRSLERLGARVGGAVQEKVWTVCEEADAFRKHRLEIDALGPKRKKEITEEDLRGYRQHARTTRRHVTELRDTVDHALDKLAGDGDSD